MEILSILIIFDKNYLSCPLCHFDSGWLNVLNLSKGEALLLMLEFCERFQVKTGGFSVVEGMPEELVLKARCFFQEAVCNWFGVLKSMRDGDMTINQVDEGNLALLWGTICCFPYFLSAEGDGFLMDLVDVINQLLTTEAGITS